MNVPAALMPKTRPSGPRSRRAISRGRSADGGVAAGGSAGRMRMSTIASTIAGSIAIHMPSSPTAATTPTAISGPAA